jgi:F420-non-reducing hydrogenase iron-sulfur subunit
VTTPETFEPKIVGFLCNWCTYAGADLAGVSRLKYPPNVLPVRVMCSGRVEPELVLKAFWEGADGVLISGCHPGDCHYIEGNYKTLRRKELLDRLLEQFGIEKDRLRLTWVSASEGDLWARVVTETVEAVRRLGPLGRTRDRLRACDGILAADLPAGGCCRGEHPAAEGGGAGGR